MRSLYAEAVGLGVIEEHTNGLAGIAETAGLDRPVPTCGDWDMADLVWHLTEVQEFWCHILATRPDGGPQTYVEPERPDDPALLPSALRDVGRRLVNSLTGVDAAERAWSWSDDHTVGFTYRRQSHEALIHHIDGLIAGGVDLPDVAPELAADGVDELVDVMLTGVPDWATFTAGATAIRLVAVETGDSWTIELGTMAGTSPRTGTIDDEPAGERLPDDAPVSVTISGSALALLLWLWGRGDLALLTVDGDAEIAQRLRALVSAATQ